MDLVKEFNASVKQVATSEAAFKSALQEGQGTIFAAIMDMFQKRHGGLTGFNASQAMDLAKEHVENIERCCLKLDGKHMKSSGRVTATLDMKTLSLLVPNMVDDVVSRLNARLDEKLERDKFVSPPIPRTNVAYAALGEIADREAAR